MTFISREQVNQNINPVIREHTAASRDKGTGLLAMRSWCRDQPRLPIPLQMPGRSKRVVVRDGVSAGASRPSSVSIRRSSPAVA